MADRRDFYDTLGVSRDATAAEIQREYRKLARTYHPDINKDPEAEQRFTEISEAYDVLSDPDARQRYDAFGPEFRRVPEGVDPATWRRAQNGGHRAAGGPSRTGEGPESSWYSASGFGDDVGIDIDDLLGSMFGSRRGGGGHRRGWGPIAGADQEVELELTVEDAYAGGRRSFTVRGPDGEQQLEVNIPAGVIDGQRIRLAGQGGRGTEGAGPGDLFLVVRLQPHPRYRVDGRDITVTLPLAPWEAALGASVAVDTPGGEAKVRVPSGTSSGRRLRLKGRGMPNPRGAPGDLYAEVAVMVPNEVTGAERRLFEELSRVSDFDPRKDV
jgi:curved DNA-binding protein